MYSQDAYAIVHLVYNLYAVKGDMSKVMASAASASVCRREAMSAYNDIDARMRQALAAHNARLMQSISALMLSQRLSLPDAMRSIWTTEGIGAMTKVAEDMANAVAAETATDRIMKMTYGFVEEAFWVKHQPRLVPRSQVQWFLSSGIPLACSNLH